MTATRSQPGTADAAVDACISARLKGKGASAADADAAAKSLRRSLTVSSGISCFADCPARTALVAALQNENEDAVLYGASIFARQATPLVTSNTVLARVDSASAKALVRWMRGR